MNAKQRLFVKHYLVSRNATQAALKAGYSEKTAGSQGQRLLKNVEIAKAVEKGLADIAAKLEITAERLKEEMAKVAFADMADFAEWDGALVKLKDSSELGRHLTAAVSEVSESPTGGLKIKLHDKLAALKALGADLGLFNKMTVDGHITVENAEAARESYLRKLEKAAAGGAEGVLRESDG